MRKLSLTKEQLKWILASCPNTGDEVVGGGWEKKFATSGGQATWWQCPSCGGWHIMPLGDDKPKTCPAQD